MENTTQLAGDCWRATVSPHGTIIELGVLRAGDWRRIAFRDDTHAGPRWHGEWDGGEHQVGLQPNPGSARFACLYGGLHWALAYEAHASHLAIVASVRNARAEPFCPARVGLRLGLDTYMERYPVWNRTLFPTCLRCEQTHFWGTCMSPEGTILGLASPDPVASWSLVYNRASYGDWGHRIYTLNLDLLNAPPLPARHPRHLDALQPGETRSWTICLAPIPALDRAKAVLADLCRAPLIDVDRLTLAPGETARAEIAHPADGAARLMGEAGLAVDDLQQDPAGTTRASLAATGSPGVRRLVAEGEGRQSEALIYLRHPWSWYLRQARAESLRIPQKAFTHNETWMGLYTQLLARLHLPDESADAEAERRFWPLVQTLFDLEKGEPRYARTRVQNTAYMAGLFAARYRATGAEEDLATAARLADFVLSFQAPSGALMGDAGAGQANIHYSCVCYPLKSVMEVYQQERRLAAADPAWQARAERHWAGVRAAMDDLVRQKDNIETEGELTFEDGMISCSAAQLGMFALLLDDPAARHPYAEAAAELLDRHRCLEQLLIPDCRMNGCTLRFWESQYDVLMTPNMMNSPHGWTSWKTYATWYLYLLTGREAYLEQTMNTLGACLQVVEAVTGRLRWGFVPDPHVRVEQFGQRTHWFVDGSRKRVFIADPARPGCGEGVRGTIGEQYVEMISDKYDGWACDNDVHEHFKCLEEVALLNTCVIERRDGTWGVWNGRMELRGDQLHVTPAESIINAVHLNLQTAREVTVHFASCPRTVRAVPGLQWVMEQQHSNYVKVLS